MTTFEAFRSGHYRRQFRYQSFMPTLVNQEWGWEDPRINVLLERAGHGLGRLDAYTRIVPDVDLFMHMHVLKEANMSSRIEGTRTEMDEAVIEQEEVIAPERRQDWREVRNYVQAINTAIQRLDTLPLSLRLLREAHAILMQGVRGERKTPGEFRVSQNWIGGATLADAVFIPPHHDDLPELLSDMEAFWHNETIQVPPLIRCAISHYQFETIHPFQDGNGRIGRLLITLYLVSRGLLAKPSLFLSAHLERHRGAYYDALTRVRESHDIGHWCRFFLQAVAETAEDGQRTFQRLLELRHTWDDQVATLGTRAGNARRLVKHLFHSPRVTVADVAAHLDISFPAAGKLVDALVRLGMLEETTGFQRNRVFLFSPYLEVFLSDPLS